MNVPQEPPRWWKWLIFWRIGLANIIAYVFIVVVFVVTQVQAADSRDRISRESDRTTKALCVFRHDLEVRVQQGVSFIRAHPDGFAGLSAASIRVSLIGQQRTIMALSSLRCPR